MIFPEKEQQDPIATNAAVVRAAELLRAGKLVAFPTETVYGLGADAENEPAVERIFHVKGRPIGHPLIVHVGSSADLKNWVRAVPAAAQTLTSRFWPGPLTLILRRSPRIPSVVTGGLDTVAIRVPNHPYALGLLRAFGGAVAAPSANRFGRVSPTRAEHVQLDLGNDVDFILDGGPCTVGIESTIVDLSSDEPAILRPGGVTREQLEIALDRPVPFRGSGSVRSPGQYESHYAPRAEVMLLKIDEIPARASELIEAGKRVVVLGDRPANWSSSVAHMPLPSSVEDAARSLYHLLREVDRLGFDVVLVTLPPEAGIGSALADRLRRAAGRRSDQFAGERLE